MIQSDSRLSALAALLNPAAARLAHALCVADAGTPGLATLADVSRHLDDWRAAIRRLEASLPLLNRVIANARSGTGAISHAAQRLIAEVDELLALYTQARGIAATSPVASMRLTLCALHEHTLNEIHPWLLTTIEFLDDPRAALEKRGLTTTGKVSVNHALTLTPSAALPRLTELLERDQAPACVARKPESGWWPVLVAFALGV